MKNYGKIFTLLLCLITIKYLNIFSRKTLCCYQNCVLLNAQHIPGIATKGYTYSYYMYKLVLHEKLLYSSKLHPMYFFINQRIIGPVSLT